MTRHLACIDFLLLPCRLDVGSKEETPGFVVDAVNESGDDAARGCCSDRVEESATQGADQ